MKKYVFCFIGILITILVIADLVMSIRYRNMIFKLVLENKGEVGVIQPDIPYHYYTNDRHHC